MNPTIHTIYEATTGTWQYIVADPQTHHAAIIDPVLDYKLATDEISTTSADSLLEIVEQAGYSIDYILETHAHADHLSASRYLQTRLVQRTQQRPLVCIGERIHQVQETMAAIYDIPKRDMDNAFDRTFADDSTFHIGFLEARVLSLAGHTPDHIGYVIGRNVFTGDSIFNPDVGSARCDFPGGSATELYRSMQKLLALPEDYKLYTGHDYPPQDRVVPEGSPHPAAIPYTTVGEQAATNKHVRTGTKAEEFVSWRTERDNTLSTPRLLRQAMNVNVRGGRFQGVVGNGVKTGVVS